MPPTPYTVELSPEAQRELDRLHSEIEPRLAPGGDLAETPEWSQSSKQRFSGLPRCCTCSTEWSSQPLGSKTPVTEDAMKRAGLLSA